MGQKKITDLQLISALADSVNVPVDNAIQTYRTTIAQLTAYIFNKAQVTGLTADTAPDPAADYLLTYDASADALKKALIGNLLINAITAQTADTSPDPAADYLLSYDASATGLKKLLMQDLLKWPVAAKTGAYTVTDQDYLLFGSTNSFTFTLPSVTGRTGKVFRFQKTDTDYTKIITISGTGYSRTLNTAGESVVVCCDGSNWIEIASNIPNYQSSWSPTLSDATNVSTSTGIWYRDRKQLIMRDEIVWSGGGGGAAFTVALPSSLTMDTAQFNGALSSENTVVGYGQWFDNGTARKGVSVFYNTTTTVGFEEITSSAGSIAGTSFANGDHLSFFAQVPISGWNA
jgi:hypothetical protein